MVVDATGLGQGTASFLERSLGSGVVEPFIFTAQSKSRLGFELLAAVNGGRLKMYAADGSGDLWFDGRLDLEFNVRPELPVLSRLGGVGAVPGRLLGKAITFRITGAADKPLVSVKPPPGVPEGLRFIESIIPRLPK